MSDDYLEQVGHIIWLVPGDARVRQIYDERYAAKVERHHAEHGGNATAPMALALMREARQIAEREAAQQASPEP